MMGRHTEFIILVALVTICIVGGSHGHPDCNRKKVVEQFLYMCTAYSTGMTGIKRETYAFGSQWPQNYPQGNGISEPVTPLQTYFATVPWQQQPENFQVKYPLNGKGEAIGLPHHPHYQHQTQQQMMQGSAGGAGGRGGQTAQGQMAQLPQKRGKSSLHGKGIDLPNEPQDFAAFNEYLNPIYADAEWQSSIERWRRDPQVNKEIYRFVRDKCCVTGCPFPDEYYELDRRVNICGMR